MAQRAERRQPPWGPRTRRNVGLLWTGQGVSVLGDVALTTTLLLWVGLTVGASEWWGPLAVAGVPIAAAAPVFVVGPFAGALVDRLIPRRVMLAVDALRILLVAALALAMEDAVLDQLVAPQQRLVARLGAIYALLFLVNACDRFFQPALISLVGDLVPSASSARVLGVSQAAASVADILGPPLAAPVLLLVGPLPALLLDAFSFAVSCLSLLAIRSYRDRPRDAHAVAAHESTRAGLGTQAREGVDFLLGSHSLRALMVTAFVAMLGAGAMNALSFFFVTDTLHASPQLFGLLTAAEAGGVVVGALLASALGERVGLVRIIWMSLIANGLLCMVYARLTTFAPAVGVLLLAGVPFGAVYVAQTPLVLQLTPRELVGRVSSYLTLVLTTGSVAGALLAGALLSGVMSGFSATALGLTFGRFDTPLLAGGVLIALAGVYALARLRVAPEEIVRAVDELPTLELPVVWVDEVAALGAGLANGVWGAGDAERDMAIMGEVRGEGQQHEQASPGAMLPLPALAYRGGLISRQTTLARK